MRCLADRRDPRCAAAGAFTPADAKPAGGKKGTKGTQQQQYLQIKMQDAPISSYRTAQSTGNSTGRPTEASRRWEQFEPLPTNRRGWSLHQRSLPEPSPVGRPLLEIGAQRLP